MSQFTNTLSEDTINNTLLEGQLAYTSGLSIDSNPYERYDNRNWYWYLGWKRHESC